MPPLLSVANLEKYYGTQIALAGISFEISPQEIFALIGPNGAGKSTTLRILATILKPNSGDIIFNNHNLSTEADYVRTNISYLPEEAGAYKILSGLEYLKFMAALYTSDRQTQKKQVDFACSVASSLEGALDHKIKTYSKGMVRKLLLARTVMSRPMLAILDEPTSGLDVVNAIEIREIIKKLAHEGMAVLLSSHNMLEIEYLSNRVAIIDKGIIHDTGTPKDLREKYAAANLEEVFVRLTATN
jgi:ABC-2 type transport system ATP-binding protein